MWKDGLFDVTWSEANEAVLVLASGDGNLIVMDQGVVGQPAAVLPGHTAEVTNAAWLSSVDQVVIGQPTAVFSVW